MFEEHIIQQQKTPYGILDVENGGPALGDAALDHGLDRVGLTFTRGDEDVGARVHDRSQSLRHAVRGHLVDVAVELCRSEERRVGKECRSRWSPYH